MSFVCVWITRDVKRSHFMAANGTAGLTAVLLIVSNGPGAALCRASKLSKPAPRRLSVSLPVQRIPQVNHLLAACAEQKTRSLSKNALAQTIGIRFGKTVRSASYVILWHEMTSVSNPVRKWCLQQLNSRANLDFGLPEEDNFVWLQAFLVLTIGNQSRSSHLLADSAINALWRFFTLI